MEGHSPAVVSVRVSTSRHWPSRTRRSPSIFGQALALNQLEVVFPAKVYIKIELRKQAERQ